MTMNPVISVVHRGLLLLSAAVCSVFVLDSSNMKQCGDLNSQEESPFIIRNIGIKMCQVRCMETGGCVNFKFDFDTLTCRLQAGQSNQMEKKKGLKRHLRTPSDVPPAPCSGTPCSLGERCLKSRSGKDVCVKAGTTFHPLRSQQPRRDKKKRPGEYSLHEACREGNLSLVKDILSEGDVLLNRTETKNGRSPVMLAARGGHVAVFDFLVSKGYQMSNLDTRGNNILHMSCYGGQVAIVKHVLKLVDINSRGQNGRTCVMIAAHRGKRELFTFLVQDGSNVSMVDLDGDNILHIACKGGQVEMVKYIMSLGLVDVNSRGQDSRTVLMIAAQRGHRKIFDLSVCAGCNVSAVDRYNDNILYLALRSGQKEMVKYIISQNLTDINRRGRNGSTPLMLAAMFGQVELFDCIMKNGGDASLLDGEGRNILHLASHEGNMKLVKHIISKNIVDVNAKTNDGKTAAEIALKNFHWALCSYLKFRAH